MTIQARTQVELLRDTLTQNFGAKHIILFGSQANGEAANDSDLDLCVITSLQNKRKIDLMREIRRELGDRISSPLDILIYSEKEFFERAQLGSTLEHKIMTEGVKVYES
ncbi:nucleotidyltransferase domain-containing protein [candidate division KSB1 bacterium]|nr:nucleotidyltransferase domain-containing protein [candidate division KSB1 bacterium]